VVRLLRDGQRIRLEDNETAQKGDIVEIIGPVDFVLAKGKLIGEEVSPD